MADTKVKVLLSFARLALSAIMGYAVWWLWTDTMPDLEWYYPVVAGFITFVFTAFMFSKLKAAGD